MNIDVRVRGRDGKLYPAQPLSRTERNRARWAAHNLVCRDHLSIRTNTQGPNEHRGNPRDPRNIRQTPGNQ